jgi:hypothetical protein
MQNNTAYILDIHPNIDKGNHCCNILSLGKDDVDNVHGSNHIDGFKLKTTTNHLVN